VTNYFSWLTKYLRGASKIKLKNANKKRTVTIRRVILLEFLKASIADLITRLFSSWQNSEGGGDGNSGDRCWPPPPHSYEIFSEIYTTERRCALLANSCLKLIKLAAYFGWIFSRNGRSFSQFFTTSLSQDKEGIWRNLCWGCCEHNFTDKFLTFVSGML
jgi:hypothetical protein